MGKYSSELGIGTVEEEFLQFWEVECRDSGDDLLFAAIDGEVDHIPAHFMPSFSSWYDACDVLSLCAVDEDDDFVVQEIKLDPNVDYIDCELHWRDGASIPTDNPLGDSRFTYVGNSKKITGNNIGCEHEVFWSDAVPEIAGDREKQHAPIIIFHALDKGPRGFLFVELEDSDFDPSKFQYSVIDTSIGTFAVQYWYDRRPLELEADGGGDVKGFSIQFGYIDTESFIPCDFSYKNAVESVELKEAFNDWYSNHSKT
mgnify:CR=1 FL=1